MTRTVYFVAASIDGYIADSEGSLDWLFRLPKVEGVDAYIRSFVSRVGPIAMGSATYEFILRHAPEAWPYAGHPTWVFTHRKLAGHGEADIRFTAADAAAVHAEMVGEAGGKDIWLMGGGKVVAQFASRGLLDELWLNVVPVVLGGGVPLLPAALLEPMALESASRLPWGAAELRYAVRRP